MKQTLADQIKVLHKDGEEFKRINISILFSIKRNQFFNQLDRYINFYNELKSHLKNKNLNDAPLIEKIERIPDLHH